jgi:hypothetical protein
MHRKQHTQLGALALRNNRLARSRCKLQVRYVEHKILNRHQDYLAQAGTAAICDTQSFLLLDQILAGVSGAPAWPSGFMTLLNIRLQQYMHGCCRCAHATSHIPAGLIPTCQWQVRVAEPLGDGEDSIH